MRNIQAVSDSYLCSNCGACYAICPKEAIAFQWSGLGRKYAVINEICIECGLCQKVCPSIDTLNLHKRYADKYIGNILNTYIGRSSDLEIYSNAQSGGVATAILTYLFRTGKIDAAVVCKMKAGNPPVVEHAIIEHAEELVHTQKSCYTPVDILSALRKTSKYRSIAIIGLPCHIQGAIHLSANSSRFHNIKYRLGLICDRTLCAGIQIVMASFVKDFNNITITWRKKDFISKEGKYYPYENAPVVVNGMEETHIIPNIYRMALKEMFTSPRCRICYDKLCTHADIVLGDPWGMTDYDKNKGDSLVLTRTVIGQQLIEDAISVGCLQLHKQESYRDVLAGQAIQGRRNSVRLYSSSFSTLHPVIDTYLLHLGEAKVIVSSKKANLPITNLRRFTERENRQMEEILDEAFRQIHEYQEMIKKNNCFIAKLKRKIKKIIRK